jgi:DNA-binding PucR family transcriptional regulator
MATGAHGGRSRGSAPPDADLAAIVERLLQRLDAIGDAMVERYRAEIVDYATADPQLLDDVRTVSVDNARSLLLNVPDVVVLSAEELERSAGAAARRHHQGIPLDAFLHAFRLWTQILWEEILAEARIDRPSEREAALHLAGRLMAHVDAVSSAGALAYLAEVQSVWSDREIVRRDLLELLLAGGEAATARRQAAALGTELADDYTVVVVHRREQAPDHALPTLRERSVLRSVVEAARTTLGRRALVGLRHGHVVALCPAAGRAEHADVRDRADAFAGSMCDAGFAVGVGGRHCGLDAVAVGFGEAREAAIAAAARTDEPPRAVAFDELLVTHLMRTSPEADRLLGELLQPLFAHDAERGGDLVGTLRAYIARGFSPTRSAQQLIVHPNTVLYRLKRIAALTGRDPQDPDDLIVLALALKHHDGR